MARVPIDQVREALHARAAALGFADARAARLADHFLDAELRGASGHGVERMRWLHGLGGLQPEAAAVETDRSEGYVRYDGGGALGYLALAEVLERELAEPPAGARLVVVADCFPTGRLGYFAEMGSRAGLVTLLSATSTPRIVHPEGGPPVTGTNPICLAVPGDPPTLVDVSMGAVTYGAVLKAAATGRAMPDGALLREDGRPESDPAEVIANRAGIMPFGGPLAHKGFALALLVEVLCRSLAGGTGHAAVALLARPGADGMAGLRPLLGGRRVPGDTGAARLTEARRSGTAEVPDDLWAWLARSH
ncbi:MAG TPA: Ldh family oxidoreductase [Gaiellales bacterium]|jgi:LDH2 family malate/lactate/ureidoglycolate dehydrogenase|nr:Ldh family oxidoreductase [Gaiellales bacterium]